jgi:hypothetical protein
MNALIRLLDGISAANIKTEPSGRTLYFPYGVLGHGYIVPGANALDRLRGALRWYLGLTIGGAGLAAPFVVSVLSRMDALAAALTAILLLSGLAIIGFGISKMLSHGMEPTKETLKLSEAVEAQARNIPRWFWPAQVVLWSLCIVGGAIMLSEAVSTAELVKAAIMTLLSVLFLAFAGYATVASSQRSEDDSLGPRA